MKTISIYAFLILLIGLLIGGCSKDDDDTSSVDPAISNSSNDDSSSDNSSDDGSTSVGTAKDADGNTYKTVTIGTQTWMAENLATTKYNDGTSIPLVTDNTAWINLSTPGYCWYNNDQAANGDTYGVLYNWYTVNTSKLCPTGWHVPTDAEWKTLEMYLGMSQSDADNTTYRGTNEGSKLAGNSALWTDGSLETNAGFGTSGFTALPGGDRDGTNGTNGSFLNLGSYGYWWSATETISSYAYARGLHYFNADLGRNSTVKKNGFSVRCLQD